MQVCQSVVAELKGQAFANVPRKSVYAEALFKSTCHTVFLQVIACVVCRHKPHYPRRRLSWQGLSHPC